MKKTIVIASALLALLSGCARLSSPSPSASPVTEPGATTNFGATSPATVTDTGRDCERNGGVWHAAPGICSYVSGP